MQDGGIPRRTLLVLGAGALAVPVLSTVGCGPGSGELPSGTIGAGNTSGLAVGAVRVVSPYALAIGRDASGVYAMELICTHQGCDLSGSIGASAIICPCHEAGFTLTGLVAQGPARSNLTHYKVTIGASGDITVDAGTLVAAGTRATV